MLSDLLATFVFALLAGFGVAAGAILGMLATFAGWAFVANWLHRRHRGDA